jgi:hypothetical protein
MPTVGHAIYQSTVDLDIYIYTHINTYMYVCMYVYIYIHISYRPIYDLSNKGVDHFRGAQTRLMCLFCAVLGDVISYLIVLHIYVYICINICKLFSSALRRIFLTTF